MNLVADPSSVNSTRCYDATAVEYHLEADDLLGVGLYSPVDAARMASMVVNAPISAQAIRRWLWGHRYRQAGTLRTAPALWVPEIGLLDGEKVLGFRDLVETLFVAVFRQKGVSLQTIRRVIVNAAELLEPSYPLSSLSFKTDGRSIVADVVDEQERRLLFDLDTGQYLLELVLDRLRDGLDYSERFAARWWPLGKDRRVVIDPERSFGRAIVSDEGVPTAALAGAFRAEKSIPAVAHWFGVPERAVEEAVSFEARLANAA